VGYFFSPADIISLTPINPLQPDRERQGPLALRLNAPIADVDNLYLYVVANQAFAASGNFLLEDLAVAPKVEVLLGGWELGVGGYYQKDQGPRGMITATGSILGQLGLFAEGVVSTSTPAFSGTIGARYLQADWHLSAVVQYLYKDLPELDMSQPGRHYLAGMLGWTDILASRVDLGLFSEANLSDGSVVLSPSIAYTPFRGFTVTLAPYVSFGPDNTEFVSQFGRLSLSLKITAGAGSF
jgi:hypothetical protein